MADLIVSIGQLAEGRFVAASATAPYFCFEAPTEELVKQKVEAALTFHEEAKKELQAKRRAVRGNAITITKVRPFSRYRRPILEVA